MRLNQVLLAAALAVAFCAGAGAANNVLVVGAAFGAPVDELMATGQFDSVSFFDARHSTPTLADLQGYSAVLGFTDYAPADAAGLGDVFKRYVDGGGGLVLNTFAFSSPWSVDGGITGSGYAPLVNVQSNTDVSGTLTAATSSAIFTGVDLAALSYYHNGQFARADLDAGATLLATDGAGVNMIAISASGRVIANNLLPESGFGNSAEVYRLTANELSLVASVPEPETWAMLGGGLGLLAWLGRRRKAVPRSA